VPHLNLYCHRLQKYPTGIFLTCNSTQNVQFHRWLGQWYVCAVYCRYNICKLVAALVYSSSSLPVRYLCTVKRRCMLVSAVRSIHCPHLCAFFFIIRPLTVFRIDSWQTAYYKCTLLVCESFPRLYDVIVTHYSDLWRTHIDARCGCAGAVALAPRDKSIVAELFARSGHASVTATRRDSSVRLTCRRYVSLLG